MPIKVMVVNEHGVVRDGLRSLLEKQRDLRVLAAASDGREAAREAEKLGPDVVVTELSMPVLNGLALTRAMVQSNPKLGVVVISIHDSSAIIRQALLAGARGYLVRDSTAEDLAKAVRAVAAGKKYFGDSIADRVFDTARRARSAADGDDLTTTERDIVRLIAEGKSNSETGALLRLSPRTVETYRIRAMRKLDIRDLPSLVKFAIRQGLTTLD
jgi:DNA-binding NarL/FixJ family response regulator